ncbi:hypothetical protein HD554DRAFT_2045976 [Boletus coccyginus]|nr:hypothetical protein HD554DRAFT_2045976 [Boletus coccyginus]
MLWLVPGSKGLLFPLLFSTFKFGVGVRNAGDLHVVGQGTRCLRFQSWSLICDTETTAHQSYLEQQSGLWKYAMRDLGCFHTY